MADLKDNIDEKLEEFQQLIVDTITSALDKSAELVLTRAKEKVPVKTGKLQSSLNRWNITEAIGAGEIPDLIEHIIGPDEAIADYGDIVEVGPSPDKPGQPYLLPALEESKPEIDRLIRSALGEARKKY